MGELLGSVLVISPQRFIHSIQSCIVNDPRITTAIIIVGCPDYANLMCHRAQTSNLDSWTGSSPPGSRFLGSEDFPNNLVKAVNTYDPAGMFRGSSLDREDPRFSDEPSKAEKMRLIPIFRKSLQKKRILNLAGGSDTLVPYQCAKPFLQWLKNATSKDGWFREGQVLIKDIVYEGVGHVMTLEMAKEAVRFVAESLRNPPATSKLSKL